MTAFIVSVILVCDIRERQTLDSSHLIPTRSVRNGLVFFFDFDATEQRVTTGNSVAAEKFVATGNVVAVGNFVATNVSLCAWWVAVISDIDGIKCEEVTAIAE